MEKGLKPIDWSAARAILGDDFISPEEVSSARGITYSQEQLEILQETLPSTEILAWCKNNNYVVMPAPSKPMSLFQIRAMDTGLFSDKPEEDGHGCYSDALFSKGEQTSSGWLAIRKNYIPGSRGRLWKDQASLLGTNEKIPTITDLGWLATTYYVVRQIVILPNARYRASTMFNPLEAADLRFRLWNDLPTISFCGCRDNDHDHDHGYVGLATALKLCLDSEQMEIYNARNDPLMYEIKQILKNCPKGLKLIEQILNKRLGGQELLEALKEEPEEVKRNVIELLKNPLNVELAYVFVEGDRGKILFDALIDAPDDIKRGVIEIFDSDSAKLFIKGARKWSKMSKKAH